MARPIKMNITFRRHPTEADRVLIVERSPRGEEIDDVQNQALRDALEAAGKIEA